MARTPCQCRGLAATDLQVRVSIGICVACARMDSVVQVHAAREQCAEPIRLSTPPMAMSSYRCITLRDYRARQTGHRIGPRSLGYKVQPRTESVNCPFPRKHLSSQMLYGRNHERSATQPAEQLPFIDIDGRKATTSTRAKLLFTPILRPGNLMTGRLG